MAEAGASLLKVKDLHAWYGESHILHGVDFEVHQGQVVTLLGRNGAGKTTTLRAIIGLLRRREGSILCEGVETILAMKPGDTVMFERSPSDPVRLRCGDVDLTEAIMGHIGNHVSVRVSRPLNPPKVTMAAFEAIDEKMEGR